MGGYPQPFAVWKRCRFVNAKVDPWERRNTMAKETEGRAYLRKRIEGSQAGPKVPVSGVHARGSGSDVTLLIVSERGELVLFISPETALRLGAALVEKGVSRCRLA